MLSAWTFKIKDPQEKDQYIKSLKHSRWILDDLSKILEEMDQSLDRQELAVAAYESPNWQYRQADMNGYRRCLKKIKSIINLDQKDE